MSTAYHSTNMATSCVISKQDCRKVKNTYLTYFLGHNRCVCCDCYVKFNLSSGIMHNLHWYMAGHILSPRRNINTYTILVRKPEVMRHFGRPKCGEKFNFKMGFNLYQVHPVVIVNESY